MTVGGTPEADLAARRSCRQLRIALGPARDHPFTFANDGTEGGARAGQADVQANPRGHGVYAGFADLMVLCERSRVLVPRADNP